jgi:FkbM family methyltransferase
LTSAVNMHGEVFTVEPEPSDFWGWIQNGKWDNALFAIFDKLLTRETNYIDIGAWIGATPLYASRRAKHVWAIEPDPVACGIMLANLAANPADAKNIFVRQIALADRVGTLDMGASMLGCSVTRMSCNANKITTDCTTLREFAAEIPEPLFIKMDVEGAEHLILADVKFFAEHKPDLLVSTHKQFWTEGGTDPDAAMAAVKTVGKLYSHVLSSTLVPIPDISTTAYQDMLFTTRDV